MAFDPSKPVSDKTACGKYTVSNFRKRRDRDDGSGNLDDYPFAVDVIEDSGEWELSVARNGNQYTTGNGYQLVNTPSPAPAVDWDKPVRFLGNDDTPLEYIGCVFYPEPADGMRQVIRNKITGKLVLRRDDGTGVSDACAHIINTPPRTVTVEIAACEYVEHGNELLATRYQDGHIRVVDAKTGSHFVYAAPGYQLEDSLGYRFTSPWVAHEFVLPLTAKE